MTKKKVSWNDLQTKIENPTSNIAYVKQLQMLEDEGFRGFMGDVIKADNQRKADSVIEKKAGE